MTEPTYKPELITGYLLGSLPAPESERLDELSITDAAFADALIAAESELVDAYVLDELGDEERRQFKKYYLASPQGRDKLRFAQTFQLFGNQQSELPVNSQNLAHESLEDAGFFSSLRSYFRPRFALQWGFATAALALLITGSWLAFQNIRLRQQVSTTQARNNELARREEQLQRELEGQQLAAGKGSPEPSSGGDDRKPDQAPGDPADIRQPSSSAVFSLVLTPQLRSAQQRPTVVLKPETSWIAIKVVLEPDDYSTYQVMLLDQETRQPVWHSANLRSQVTDGSESLDIRIKAGQLRPRGYLLRVTGIAAGASDVVGEYPIRVMKQ